MRKRLIIILILGLIGILTLKLVSKPFANTDTIIGRISNILNKNNTIDLNCIGIEKKEINITWYPEMIDTNQIIRKGRQVGKIGYEYGPNRFRILLKNGLVFNVGHFKTNNWHSHRYEIGITKDTLGYKLEFIAKGPDFERIEQDFNLKGAPNGQIIAYYKNGVCSFKGKYVQGLKQGHFIYYHRNGKVRSTVDYLDDELHGYKTDFDENGNIKWKTEYVNGQKIKKNE